MTRAGWFTVPLWCALAVASFAQQERKDVFTGGKGLEETANLNINGGADIVGVYQSPQVRETALWVPGGDPPHDRTHYFISPDIWLSFEGNLQDNVTIFAQIRSIRADNDPLVGPPDWQDTGPVGDPDLARLNLNFGSNLTPIIKYAWVRISDPDLGWSFILGQQEAVFNLRGNNAFFLDASRSESPWGDVLRAWATTIRGENNPAGARIVYSRDQVTAEIVALPVIVDALRLGAAPDNANQQAIYYLDVIYNVDDRGSKVAVIGSVFHGAVPRDNVYTVGGAFTFTPVNEFTVFAEGYYQWGLAWTDGRAGIFDLPGSPFGTMTEDGDHIAWAVMAGFLLNLSINESSSYFLEGHFLWITGHDMDGGASFGSGDGIVIPTNDESTEFMSYENYDVMTILNSNEWGFDLDNNLMQITAQTGVKLSTGSTMPQNLHIVVNAAWARAIEDWEVPAGSENEIGYEVDLTVRLHFNKNSHIYVTGAYMGASKLIELFTSGGDAFAWLFLIGVGGQY